VDRANRVLEAQFGVRLDAGEPRAWDRGDRSQDLSRAAADLSAVDEGRGADWVIGFASALPFFSDSPHQLGLGLLFGRHMVLRGMDSLAEAQAIDQAFDKLPARERDQLTRERRLHKETAVLLHEWAHTLGAFHERSSDWIMSSSYGARVSAFSPGSAEIIRLGLRHRDATDPASRADWGAAYREVLARNAGEAWSAESREQALADAARWFGAGPAVPGAAARSAAAPPRSGAEARRACQAATARAPRSREALEACRAAAEAPGATPEEQIRLAHALLEQKDVPGALAVAARAEAALWVEQAGPRWWSAVAQVYGRADTCSAAERAASRAEGDPAAEQVVADCTRLRRSVGLPRGEGRVPEAREHEYVAAVQEAQREILRRRTEEALERARRIEKAFPGSAGSPLVRCIARAEDRPRARARARADCLAAAEAAPEAIQPQYLLGLAAADEGRWQVARDHWRRAVQLDEGMGVAWVKLATAHQKLGEQQALEALKAGYQARFGMPLRLPP
jgi:tetratricopeptide (TPR) repeat protein